MVIRIETRKKYAKVIDVDVKNSESSIHLEFWEENAFVLPLFPSDTSMLFWPLVLVAATAMLY